MRRRRVVVATVAGLAVALLGNGIYASFNNASELKPTDVLRSIDLVASVSSIILDETSSSWTQNSSGTVQVALDDLRVLTIAPGTMEDDYDTVPRCSNFTTPNACVLLADMLGEAVVWFAIVAADAANGSQFLTLPGLIDMQANGDEGILRNGWVVNLATPVKRLCEDVDTSNLRDFITQFPDSKSSSLVNLTTDNVVSVECVKN